jgi:hypothetical protein
VPEFRVAGDGCGWQGPDHQRAARRHSVEAVTAQMAEPALDTMAHDGVADGATDDEPHKSRAGVVVGKQVHHEGPCARTTS